MSVFSANCQQLFTTNDNYPNTEMLFYSTVDFLDINFGIFLFLKETIRKRQQVNSNCYSVTIS